MYFPIQNHTHYSLLQGFNRPEKLADKAAKLGLPSLAITDYSLAGSIEFVEKMEAKKVKPVLGYNLYVRVENNDRGNYRLYNIILLCKTLRGWQNLVKLSSKANSLENFQYQAANQPKVRDGYPSFSLEGLEQIQKEDLICVVGGLKSLMMWPLFKFNQASALLTSNEGDCRGFLSADCVKEGEELLVKLRGLFPDLYLGRTSCTTMPAETLVNNSVKYFADKLNIPLVPLNDSHYSDPADFADQKIILLNLLETKSETVLRKLELEHNAGLYRFFQSAGHHLGGKEFTQTFSEREIKTGLEILEKIESFKITKNPSFRPFDCPGGMGDAEFLRQLCREGWKEKIDKKIPQEKQQIYVDRIKSELEILQGAGLSSYFLCLWDVVKFIKSNNWLPGCARGSSAGCLVSYLTSITQVDPIRWDLLFERFYDASRNIPGKVSLPDIDLDVPITHRDKVIEYIKKKYDSDKVSQICTFQQIKGRNAIKEVLRSSGNISYDEMNKITEFIPDEAKIADELAEMKEEDGFASILQWSLENRGKKLEEWVKLDKDTGLLEGPLSKKFEQAIRIEGCKIGKGRHAAGVIISQDILAENYPMILDPKSKNMIIAYDMIGCEKAGLPKMDILGIALLDKVMGVRDILKTGDLNES